jgi:thiol-disulfide isomerase/thioredoxin
MKKTILYSVLAALCLFSSASGQNKPKIKALEIGDQVPDLFFRDLFNYRAPDGKPMTAIQLSALKGKLVILDFWASWCSSCIDGLARSERLSAQFKNDLVVIGVNTEPWQTVQQFFQRQKAKGRAFNFPTICSDTQLSQLFPHRYIPHYVWINGLGKVIAITAADELNEANIQKALGDAAEQFAEKKDIDPAQPLFLQQDFPIDSLIRYSVFVRYYYPGAGSTARERKKNGMLVGQAYTGYSLLKIYRSIAMKLFKQNGEAFSEKRLLLDTRDSVRFLKDDQLVSAAYQEQRPAYLYDFIVPPAKRDSLYELMLADLNRYSGYEGRMAKRRSPCLALQRTQKQTDLTTKGGETGHLGLERFACGTPEPAYQQPGGTPERLTGQPPADHR